MGIKQIYRFQARHKQHPVSYTKILCKEHSWSYVYLKYKNSDFISLEEATSSKPEEK